MEPETYLALRHIAVNQLAIRLLNIYKGLPISYDATITELGNDYIVVKTTNYQIVCLYLDRETIIQSDYLPHSLSAKVYQINPSSFEVVLTQFESIRGEIGIRNRVRVEPDTPINITISSFNSHYIINTHVYDISQDGLGVVLEKHQFSPSIYFHGAKLLLCLQLQLQTNSSTSTQVNSSVEFNDPMARFTRERMRFFPFESTKERKHDERSNNVSFREEAPELKAEATIRYIKPDINFTRYRIGFTIKTSDFNRGIINQYISQRQSELIAEIRSLYNTLTSSPNQ